MNDKLPKIEQGSAGSGWDGTARDGWRVHRGKGYTHTSDISKPEYLFFMSVDWNRLDWFGIGR